MAIVIKYVTKMLLLVASLLFFSCTSSTSLQEYLVEGAQRSDFISVDLPASILKIDQESLTKEQKEAYKSVKKLNVLILPLKDDNQAVYNEERMRVNEILKSGKYQDLMRINDKHMKGVIKYLGTDEEIDELILFGSSDDKGFALVRVLGKDMKPENMSTLIEALQRSNIDEASLGGLKQFF